MALAVSRTSSTSAFMRSSSMYWAAPETLIAPTIWPEAPRIGRGDAADAVLVLFQVEGDAALGVVAHPVDPLRFVGRAWRGRAFGSVERAPAVLALIQHQRLAQARRTDRLTIAHARADVDPASARQLVEIERSVVVQHAQVHRVLGVFPELFEMRPRDARQVHLLAGQIAELQELGAKAVAFARRLRQEPALDQRCGEAVCRAAGQAQLLRQPPARRWFRTRRPRPEDPSPGTGSGCRSETWAPFCRPPPSSPFPLTLVSFYSTTSHIVERKASGRVATLIADEPGEPIACHRLYWGGRRGQTASSLAENVRITDCP